MFEESEMEESFNNSIDFEKAVEEFGDKDLFIGILKNFAS